MLAPIDWKARCLAAEDALRRARSKLFMSAPRKRILALLADLPPGVSMTTPEVAVRLHIKRDTAACALRKLNGAGFVDRSKKAGYNGAPVRWWLGHMVVPSEDGQ